MRFLVVHQSLQFETTHAAECVISFGLVGLMVVSGPQLCHWSRNAAADHTSVEG